jgi:hypothetical protein
MTITNLEALEGLEHCSESCANPRTLERVTGKPFRPFRPFRGAKPSIGEPRMTTDPKQHEQLTAANERVALLTAELHRAEGERDRLLREQLDNTGAHDQRVCVR